MPNYRISAADRAPLPASYRAEPRHLGYDDRDNAQPFAKYLKPTGAVQDHVRDALSSGAAPSEYGYEIGEAPQRLSARGYERLETGWARTEHGTLVVHCLTDMPGVTAQMWDWWFGWHSTDSARYKLWHPDAHQFAAIGEDRSTDRTLTDRQRYHDNVSYVDEYIGSRLNRLAIRFVDPGTLGFEDAVGTTHICAHVGTSQVPVGIGWLVHQVRPTDHGCEMRSRFALGHGGLLDIPAHSTSMPALARLMTNPVGRLVSGPVVSVASRYSASDRLGHDLLHHCATEMNHLATFLPELYAEFNGSP